MLRTLLVALFLFSLVAPAAAQAPDTTAAPARRVAVLAFTGGRVARSQRALATALTAAGYTVVPDAELAAVPAAAHAASADDYVAVAAATHALAVITGTVTGAHHATTVTVTVFSPTDGAERGTASWTGEPDAPRIDGAEKLAPFIAPPAGAAGPGGGPAGAGAVDTETEAEAEQHDEDEQRQESPVAPSSPTADDARWDSLAFEINGGTLHRSMSATVMPDRLHGANETRTYETAGAGGPAFGAAVEVYPGAMLSGQPFPWAGLVARYSRGVGLLTHATSTMTGGEVTVGTESQELYLGVRGRVALFAPVRKALMVELDVGYDLFTFMLDTTMLQTTIPQQIVPGIAYQDLQVALGVSYPVVPKYLRVGLRGVYRLGLGVGADARHIWGNATNGGDTAGATLTVRGELPELVRGLYAGVDLDWFAYYTKFSGTTSCATASCTSSSQPWEALHIPHGVTDSYVRVLIVVGYALR